MLRDEMATHWPSSEKKRSAIRQTRVALRSIQVERVAAWLVTNRARALSDALVAKVWLLVWWQLAPDCESPPREVRCGPAPDADAEAVAACLVELGWPASKAERMARPVYQAQTDGQMDGDLYVSRIYGVTYGYGSNGRTGIAGGVRSRCGGKRADARMSRGAKRTAGQGSCVARPGADAVTTGVVATPDNPAEETTMKTTKGGEL